MVNHLYLAHLGEELETILGDITFYLNDNYVFCFNGPYEGVMEFYYNNEERGKQKISYKQDLSGKLWDIRFILDYDNPLPRISVIIKNCGETKEISKQEEKDLSDLFASEEALYLIKNYQH